MGVKNCDNHTRYAAGCPDCLHRSRAYEAARSQRPQVKRQIKLAYGDAEAWGRMTEIGKRWEEERRI